MRTSGSNISVYSLLTHAVISHTYTAISKTVVIEDSERWMSKGACTTERNCGYAIWNAKFHKLRSSCVKMNTPTMNVCPRALSWLQTTKETDAFLNWKTFLVSSYERPVVSDFPSPVTRKFRNKALNCSFRNAQEKWSLCNWMLKNMDKPCNLPLNVYTGAGIID